MRGGRVPRESKVCARRRSNVGESGSEIQTGIQNGLTVIRAVVLSTLSIGQKRACDSSHTAFITGDRRIASVWTVVRPPYDISSGESAVFLMPRSPRSHRSSRVSFLASLQPGMTITIGTTPRRSARHGPPRSPSSFRRHRPVDPHRRRPRA